MSNSLAPRLSGRVFETITDKSVTLVKLYDQYWYTDVHIYACINPLSRIIDTQTYAATDLSLICP